jgi:hypothetical protein
VGGGHRRSDAEGDDGQGPAPSETMAHAPAGNRLAITRTPLSWLWRMALARFPRVCRPLALVLRSWEGLIQVPARAPPAACRPAIPQPVCVA